MRSPLEIIYLPLNQGQEGSKWVGYCISISHLDRIPIMLATSTEHLYIPNPFKYIESNNSVSSSVIPIPFQKNRTNHVKSYTYREPSIAWLSTLNIYLTKPIILFSDLDFYPALEAWEACRPNFG